MRDDNSVKEGEGPLRTTWINLLPEKLKITKISSKPLPLQKQFNTNNLANYRTHEILYNKPDS